MHIICVKETNVIDIYNWMASTTCTPCRILLNGRVSSGWAASSSSSYIHLYVWQSHCSRSKMSKTIFVVLAHRHGELFSTVCRRRRMQSAFVRPHFNDNIIIVCNSSAHPKIWSIHTRSTVWRRDAILYLSMQGNGSDYRYDAMISAVGGNGRRRLLKSISQAALFHFMHVVFYVWVAVYRLALFAGALWCATACAAEITSARMLIIIHATKPSTQAQPNRSMGDEKKKTVVGCVGLPDKILMWLRCKRNQRTQEKQIVGKQ